MDQYQSMTKERWEEILECKKRFLQNNDENPLLNPHMSKEVAASWIRSKKMGINPLKKATEPHLTPTEHRKVLNDNRALIDIVRPIINTFKDMAVLTSGYILYLCEKNGAFLLQEGDMMRVPTDGLIWNENTVGTNVHSLSMRLKKPVQLMGPEHYLVALENIIASAAPIMDESGEAIATLILSQPLVEKPWEEGFEDWRSHTLGLITSIAAAVEAQMKLNKSNQKLQESYNDLRKVNDNLMTAHNTLEATLAFIDEGIITIDRRGIIIHINQEGLRILKIKPDEIGTRNIQDFLGKHSRVMSLVSKGKKVDVEETIFVKNDEQPYVINIRPVINPSSKDVDAAVLRLNHTEKINAMVAKRSGSIVRYRFEDIIGKDTGLKKVVDLARRFAHSPENVLLIGESGSGKELFAQAIHTESRPQGPFMAVNCAALPRELIESELFGYEGGSFTGAERSGRPGKIELAHGGTLFLDEIGDMPLELQAVLLRTIEDKQVMRVGGRRYNKVDFRLIAATNRNLYNMVKENQFREDLYFRLSVLTINIPPLRARKEDIEILSKYFIETYCHKQGWKVPTLSPAAQARINEYEWPGNVRQLQNAMIYAVNTTLNDTIMAEDLPSYINLEIVPTKVDGGEDYFNDDEALSLQNIERNAIKAAMLRAENYIPAAAEILGISKSTLYRKLKEYEIQY